MSAVLAARMGDSVGNHSSGFWAGLGMVAGLVAGALIGAALIVATGGAALIVVAAATAGALCITAAAGAAGERLGEAYDTDNATGVPCSPIILGFPTVLIESMPAARIFDAAALCLITKTPAAIKDGSGSVYIGKQPASRHKDSATCTGTIIPRTKYTYIGGPTVSSGAPYQETTAGFLHDMGTALEVEAKYTGYAALALGALAAGPAIAAGYASAGLAGGALAAGIAGGGLALGYGATIGGTWVGQKVGAAVDDTFGYTDGRYEAFLGTWGGIGGGILGGKIAEVAGAKAMKAAKGGKGGGAGEGEGEPGGPEGKDEKGPGGKDETDPNAGKTDPKDPTLKTDDEGECATCDKTNEKKPGDTPETEPKDPANKLPEPSPKVEEAIKSLPEEVQDAVRKSPKLQAQLDSLLNDPKPWEIINDPSKTGAWADRNAHKIVLGKGMDNANVLAHEVGHANYDMNTADPYITPDQATSRDDYINRNVDRNFRDEGEASFNEQVVSRDVEANGGQPTAPANSPNAAIYDRYQSGQISRDQAVQEMGNNFENNTTSNTGQKYRDYYSNGLQEHWDATIQPARNQAALDAARANGSMTEAEYQARSKANADDAAQLKADWAKYKSNIREAWKAVTDLRAGKITRAEYDAKIAALKAGSGGGGNGAAKSPAPATPEDCPTCGGAKGAPLASDAAAPAPGHDHGLTQAQMDAIIATAKGSRPLPETYLDAQYIKDHLAQFKDGAAKFQLKDAYDQYGPSREDGTSFMMPKADADALQAKYANDPRGMEKALGLPDGSLDNGQLVRVDVANPENHGLTVPSGNEAGANSQWLPGGKLPQGNSEGVLSTLGSAPPGSHTTTPVNIGPAPAPGP